MLHKVIKVIKYFLDNEFRGSWKKEFGAEPLSESWTLAWDYNFSVKLSQTFEWLFSFGLPLRSDKWKRKTLFVQSKFVECCWKTDKCENYFKVIRLSVEQQVFKWSSSLNGKVFSNFFLTELERGILAWVFNNFCPWR